MMQQTSQSAAPATAAQGQTPTSVTIPGGTSFRIEELPQSAQGVLGLMERRDLLRRQINDVQDTRNELASQLSTNEEGQTLAPEARVGIQQRINVLDARILELEGQQAKAERLISNSRPELLAQAQHFERDYANRVDQDEAMAISAMTFVAGIVLTTIVGWFRRRRARKRGAQAVQAIVAEDPRIDRLTQSVEAMAEELERIGEGQRFVTQLMANRQAAALSVETERR